MSFSGGGQGHSALEETGVQSRQSVSKPHGHPPTRTPQCLPPPKGLSSPGPCGLGLTMVAQWVPWHLGYKAPQHSLGLWLSGPVPGLPTSVPASGRSGARR